MGRLVDLSHVIEPGRAGRKFELRMVGAEEIDAKLVRLPNQWYIMHEIGMVSHLATHLEAPYHYFKDGADLAGIPLETLQGPAAILDLRGIEPGSLISPGQLQTAAGRAGGIGPGDIVLCHLGYAGHYGTPDYDKAPRFETAAIEWLIASGMKMMGVDASGVELPGSEEHPNHQALFKRGIPLIENLAGLDQLRQSRVKVYAFPIAVRGLESFPLRVVAEED